LAIGEAAFDMRGRGVDGMATTREPVAIVSRTSSGSGMNEIDGISHA